MAEGQMTQSTYLEIDECPARISTEETARALADAKQVAALAELIDSGAKNLFAGLQRVGTTSSNAQQTYTIGGVKFTVNSDTTITIERVSSTSSSQAVWCYNSSAAILLDNFCDGNYVFATGLESNPKVRVRLAKLDNGSYMYINSAATIPASTETGINVSISVDADFSGTVTCKPMVCSKAAWEISKKIVPYCPPLAELYAMIQNA